MLVDSVEILRRESGSGGGAKGDNSNGNGKNDGGDKPEGGLMMSMQEKNNIRRLQDSLEDLTKRVTETEKEIKALRSTTDG